jgi:formylglycine-generating enzyme required for sulfatase activity
MELDPDLALGPLIKVLEEPDAAPGAVGNTAYILGEMGTAAKPALPALIAALEHADPDVRMDAVVAIEQIAPQERSFIPLYTRLLGDEDQWVCASAARALGSFGAAARDAVPELKKALTHESGIVRLSAIAALTDMNIAVPGAFEICLACMQDPDSAVRCTAAALMAQVATDKQQALPVLKAALKDEDAIVRVEAAGALVALGTEPDTVLPTLQEELQEGYDYGSIAQILGDMGKDAASTLPVLERISRRTDLPADVMASIQDAISKITAASPGADDDSDGKSPAPTVAQNESTIPVPGRAWTVPGLGLELVYVEKGSFQMGSANVTNLAYPVHPVRITRSFWMGKYEVTQKQYKELAGTNPSQYKGDTKPVERVTWHEAVAFCEALTEREQHAKRLPEGYKYRLPTEAEWEHAARGGKKGGDANYVGPHPYQLIKWHFDNYHSKAHPVGAGRKNTLGLYEMSGNVWEWCLDWHVEAPYETGPATDPLGPPMGKARITKGGLHIYAFDGFSPAAYRDPIPPKLRDEFLGFRVVLAPRLRSTHPDAPQEKVQSQNGIKGTHEAAEE